MKKLFAILFLLVLSFTVKAATVNVTEFGAIPNDNGDDTQAVRNAVSRLVDSGGGTLVFPAGTTDINGEIPFINYGNYQTYRLVGDGGAFIRLNGDGKTDYFKFGNVNQAEVDGLIFYAPAEQIINAQTVIQSGYTSQTRITNCSFFGIGAETAVIDAHNTDLIVEKSLFEGTSARLGVIRSKTSRGITVKNTSFVDYAHFLNMYLTKVPHLLPGSWIKIENEDQAFGANGQRIARIQDCRFDEGALRAIDISNHKAVEISGISVNVNGIDDGIGVMLDNVEFAEVKFSAFGYSQAARPAISLKNRSFLEATSLQLVEAVYFLKRDKSSSFTVKACAKCVLLNGLK
ncbi:MAG: hypothetical protein WA584_14645 [Pyrinomonadaceae bacterium]